MTKKIKCPNCGFEYDEGTEFCPNCDVINPNSKYIHKKPTAEEILAAKQMEQATDEEIRQRLREKYEQETKTLEKEELKEALDEAEAKHKADKVPESEVESVKEAAVSSATQEKQTESAKISEDKSWKRPEKRQEDEASSSETSDDKKTGNKKRNNLIFGVVIVLLLGAGIWGYNKYESNAREKRAAQTEKAYKQAKIDFEKLYFDENKIFLHSDVSKDKIDKASDKIETIDNKEFQEDLKEIESDVRERFEKQDGLNILFDQPVLVGDTLDDKALVKENISSVSLEISDKEQDAFDKKINEGIQLAKDQVEDNNKAKELMTVVFKDNKIVENVKREDYNKAKEAVGKIKRKELKETFEKQLKSVDDFLVAKEKETKEKEAAQAAANAQAAGAAPSQNAQANQAAQGSGTNIFGADRIQKWHEKNPTVQSGMLSNLDPGAVSSDPWVWAPGVQETVLNECFRRGYIVEGGFYLVQSKIVDGEGYYDLYATDTSAPLFNNWKPATPYYLVTINCKTGWFKGNGSDGTL
ncbi:cell division site-positioning protein MapZ family protein [Vagococcus elongatus]|uniref:Uncharacterized protein n=1 Tax=Vagococcus elongatus TaxID=180344 RepID=A0A430AZY1_9ENTE|nr:cell division site-positioning protein MapZ family protein [Vagococcus elongatus]RSU13561.1 hypothetical protein CBF29_04730 [Vagococcus elongatus]